MSVTGSEKAKIVPTKRKMVLYHLTLIVESISSDMMNKVFLTRTALSARRYNNKNLN